MVYVLVEPISLGALMLFFIVILMMIMYLTYFFAKRKRILDLRKMSTIFIIGMPNSGRTLIMNRLSNTKEGFLDKSLNISYMQMVYDGMTALKVVDYHGIIYKDGKLNSDVMNDIKAIDPKCIIAIIDVSIFSEHIENQIQLILKIKEVFKNKRIFLVANKVDRTSKDKIKDIERVFGKDIYKVRINQLRDIDKLKIGIINYLTKRTIPSSK